MVPSVGVRSASRNPIELGDTVTGTYILSLNFFRPEIGFHEPFEFFFGEGLVFLLHRISFSQFEKKLQGMSHRWKTHASVDGSV